MLTPGGRPKEAGFKNERRNGQDCQVLQSKVETGLGGCWGWQLGGVQGLREPLSHWGLVEVRWPGFEEYLGGKSQSWGVLAPSGSLVAEEPRMGRRGGEWWEACLQGL